MLRVGFELMTLVFEQTKTDYAFDRLVTVIGCCEEYGVEIWLDMKDEQQNITTY
jgi:hypothetical protein